jgi:hypothetical protein
MTVFFDRRSHFGICRLAPGVMAMLLCIVAIAQAQQSAATEPTTRPADSSSFEQIQAGIRQLGDDDPQIRDAASQRLMGLDAADLPTLHAAAKSLQPLNPAQIVALRDIVTQVFLSPPRIGGLGGPGFLGIYWPPNSTESNQQGLIVAHRIPGFVAYQMLRDDDVIIGVVGSPQIKLQDKYAFIQLVGMMRAGETLRLQVQRGGKVLEIPIVLDARTADFDLARDPDSVTRLVARMIEKRRDRADEYWKTNFADMDRNSAISTTQ